MRIPRGLVALLAAAACAAPVSLSMAQTGGSVEGQAAVHLVEAEKHTAAGDYRAAIIELKNAVLEAPRSPRLRYRLGNVYAEIGDLGSAQKELERAVDLDPEWIEARLALGEVWLSLGETDRVVNELWAAEAPAGTQRAQVYVLHGLAQLEDGDIDAARESFRAALEEHPDDGPAYLGMARAALAEGDLSMAELHLENAEQGVGAEQAQVLRLKGDLALNRRDYGAAEEAFRKVVESNPHRAWARRDLARALIELGKLDEADRHLDEVLEARPKDYDAVFLKGYSAYRQGDFASALERMSAVLAVADKFAPALYVSGASALAIGQNERARRDLGRFMQMEPADRPGRRLYAEALLRLGDASEAYTVLRPLAEARPGDPAVLALLGTAAVMSGDVGAGLEHLERAAALAPADDGMRARVAAARLAATEREEGLRELERLIQEQP
ncbi:MAG: tetratricopeptide repeat protein, partial [Chromatiales bacterium]